MRLRSVNVWDRRPSGWRAPEEPASGETPAADSGPQGLTERLLMGLLIGGVAIGCILVLWPFFSAILWAGILVFTTWPVYEWIRRRSRLQRPVIAGLMVALTAVIIVLPLALAAPVN